MTVEAGLTATLERTVTEEDTAIRLRTGDVPVLATPSLITWCEEATMMALLGELEPGTTSVGMRIRVDHLLPTRVGETVRIEATLSRVEGRRLTFDVSAFFHEAKLADGQIVRVTVDKDRFMNRVTKAYDESAQ